MSISDEHVSDFSLQCANGGGGGDDDDDDDDDDYDDHDGDGKIIVTHRLALRCRGMHV